MIRRRALLAASPAATLAAPSLAQAPWPNRTIRIVVTFPPGGLADTTTRLMAPVMTQELGQNVVIENRPGNAGILATEQIARAAPDGYTLLASHAIVHVFAAATRPTLPFDPIADFTHMALLTEAPTVLAVRGQSPVRSFAELMQAARTRPVRYGSPGVGSAPHLLGALLGAEARAEQFEHVPYQGSAPALQAVLGGSIECFLDAITTNVEPMRAGTLRGLAVSSPQRLPALPDLPTFAELGFPRLTSAQWVGLSGPRGLPAPIVERLQSLAPRVLLRPEILPRFQEVQTLPREQPVVGDAFVRLIREQLAHGTSVAREARIEIT
jgi:tripartite-type tricarboxylate transporter receptor subunit TctC